MRHKQKKVLYYLLISFLLMIISLFLCDFLYTNKLLFYSEDFMIDSVIHVFAWAIVECFLLDPIGIALIGCSIAYLHKKGKDKVEMAVILLLSRTNKNTLLFIWGILITTSIISISGFKDIRGFCGLFSLISIPVAVFYTTFWIFMNKNNFNC